MTEPSSPYDPHPTPPRFAARLWAAGLATAAVAALIALAGATVARAVLDTALLSADPLGLGWSGTATYAAGAAVLAVLLTGVLHLLLVAVPRPVSYFGWIVTLVGVILVVLPFLAEASRASQVATAVVSGLVVVATGSLLGAQGAAIDRRRVRAAR